MSRSPCGTATFTRFAVAPQWCQNLREKHNMFVHVHVHAGCDSLVFNCIVNCTNCQAANSQDNSRSPTFCGESLLGHIEAGDAARDTSPAAKKRGSHQAAMDYIEGQHRQHRKDAAAAACGGPVSARVCVLFCAGRCSQPPRPAASCGTTTGQATHRHPACRRAPGTPDLARAARSRSRPVCGCWVRSVTSPAAHRCVCVCCVCVCVCVCVSVCV
jgi:hypothetical protein